MNPILFDVSAYLAVTRSPVKAPLNDALGAEVSDYQGTQVHHKSRVRHSNACSLSNSEVIQFMRCSLTAKRLLGGFTVPLSISSRSYWPGSILKNLSCKAKAPPESIVEPIHEV